MVCSTRTADSLIAPEKLDELLTYWEASGVLTWNARTGPDSKRFNSARAYKVAFTARNRAGYQHGTIFGKTYLAHRVIWAIVHRQWPDGEIDHINGDRTDNRICNLRHVDSKTNCRNQRRPKNSTSGVVGVRRHFNKWKVVIGVDRKTKYLGLYDTLEEAVRVRKRADEQYGFHQNHGSAKCQ